MKIGMMVDTYKPYVSGVTTHVDLTKRALEKMGHEVYVFTFGDTEYQDEEPRIIRSPGLALADTGFYLSLRYRAAARRLLQSMDLVHVHHPFLSGRIALRYLRRKQIPVVFTNHTRYDLYARSRAPYMPSEVSNGLLHAYMPDFCDHVDLVISPSHGMERILRQYGVTSRVEVVPNGIDLKAIQSVKPMKRAQLGFAKTDNVLVYAGRIAPEKNIPFLVQAFAGVARLIPNLHLLIIGGGQEEHEDEIKYTAHELGVQSRVRFTGMVPNEQLPAYLGACDAFVTASVTEVHPISVIEGLACGLPVLGIDSPGISDSIRDGETGLLSINDLAAYTAKLTYLCLNRDLQKKMGKAAQASSAQFAIEHTARVMLKHYNRLLEKTRPIKPSLDERLREVLKEFLP